MKRAALIAVLVLLVVTPGLVLAGGSTAPTKCKTRYPVVLAHGAGVTAKVFGIVDAWWGIEDAIEDEGGNVYITAVNGMDGTAAKAVEFKRQYLQILAAARTSKANIIGHSHGTLYTRYAISNLGLSSKVASYTSLSGPHRGSC
ncbi:MAG: alpha/beta hydrolase, partial [Pseudomonadota bacterium]